MKRLLSVILSITLLLSMGIATYADGVDEPVYKAKIRVGTSADFKPFEYYDENDKLIGFDIDTEHWTLKDGYYYYTEALEPEQTTYPLFTKIQFSAQMDNIYQKSTANVDIKVHAVQVAHNGETVFEASGWPADE